MRKYKFYQKFKILSNSKLFSDLGQIQKPKYLDSNYNYEELCGSKLKFRGTWSEIALFSKNTKFHKTWTLPWIFTKFNLKRFSWKQSFLYE